MSQDAVAAVEALLHRLLPAHTPQFRFEIIPSDNGRDVMEIASDATQIIVRGSSGSAMSSALHWYLKHHCHVHLSSCGNQLTMPEPLPRLKTPERRVTPYRYRYYFNYCTFSYSTAFWDWNRWAREIDWMALAGINMPLAITGQEAIWQRVYRAMGLSDNELSEFFAGPAFLAWNAMGNLDGWGGPLPQSWLDGQRRLQRQILARQRALGMTPLLPAFTGHVPPALQRHFPEARIRRMENWAGNFPGTFLLDSQDPLFQQIGEAFIRQQTHEYGTDHYYACDCFNENSPPDGDEAYLTAVGQNLLRAMTAADPDARCVMQGWMFYFNPTDPDYWQPARIQTFLDSMPHDRLIMLDLHSETAPIWNSTEAYYGKPWLWNVLHNFGGQCQMFGNLERLAQDLPDALHSEQRGNLVGMGMTPEGVGQNPVIYDLATDLIWRDRSPDLDAWLMGYIRRRYGATPDAACDAWRILNRTVYARPHGLTSVPGTMINVPPRLDPGDRAERPYALAELAQAWRQLASCAEELGHVDAYAYDLVDVSRQVLSELATPMVAAVRDAFAAVDHRALTEAGEQLLTLLTDLDELLATRKEFLLGRWLHDAKAWGRDDAERDLMEWNARTQVTLWGNRESMLRDYARKEWAGLVGDYYRERWQRFLQRLDDCLANNEPYDAKVFQRELCDWEAQWAHQHETYPDEPVGDAVATSLRLLARYATKAGSKCNVQEAKLEVNVEG